MLLDYALDQQALRAESGAGISGEVVAFRDPDAAIILAIGSAGATMGEPVQDAAPNLTAAWGAVDHARARSRAFVGDWRQRSRSGRRGRWSQSP